tara:strand:- start:214 stop:1023 length:810 start_codon:yes stop_codon:yes gene_type:complete
MRNIDYLVVEYRRLMHLAAVPGHILLTMTRKFVESTLHELLAYHGVEVDDSLNIEKLRDRLKKNPNIEFPLQKDAQVQTIQMFGNLSVHHKHEPIDSNESWNIVYPALKDYTRWLFRDVFNICEEFDEFEPLTLGYFAQYGFRIDEGIFRIIDGKSNIQTSELENFRDSTGLLFSMMAPELSSILKSTSQILFSDDLTVEHKQLVLDCMIATAWWAPYCGIFALTSENDRTILGSVKSEISEEAMETLSNMMNPTDTSNVSNLDPDEWA